MNYTNKDIRYIKGVGEKRAKLFNRLGVKDADALFGLYPRSYQDWSNPMTIAAAPFDIPCCIKARIFGSIKEQYIRKNMTIFKFKATDDESVLSVTIFNNKFLADKLKTGEEYLFYGRADGNLVEKLMSSPEIRKVGYQKIRPIYPSTSGLSSNIIEKIMLEGLIATEFPETLPQQIINQYNLCSRSFAIHNIHFPASLKALETAKDRLIFEELFILQIGMLSKKEHKNIISSCVLREDYRAEFWSKLPFSPTDSQQRVVAECVADMMSGKPMSRLIQGDVGSGKTAIAAALIYCAVKNGMQAAFMAPTEILAEQHYKTLSAFFDGCSFNIENLTGAVTKSKKNKIKVQILSGNTDIVIGTHALLQDDVKFNNLGLVITDEQHRFGVAQRTLLQSKGNNPHIMVMSATPIPRTLSLVIFGDLDVSTVDTLPKGRQKIETYAVKSGLHERVYNFLKKHIDEGRQAFIVCPLVEEGETDLVPAEEYAKQLSENQFKDYSVGLLHGKMKPKQKDDIMRQFADGKIQLLVATTVIEVGIDVPNAVVMVVENAERFGLSQLHQLRGRIGRGLYKSTCILISDAQNKETVERLRIMSDTCDGFKIAEYDLKSRGPGDFLGKRQHGLPDLKIANLANDMYTLRMARTAAKDILKSDPNLSSPQNKPLADEVERMFESAAEFGYN